MHYKMQLNSARVNRCGAVKRDKLKDMMCLPMRDFMPMSLSFSVEQEQHPPVTENPLSLCFKL